MARDGRARFGDKAVGRALGGWIYTESVAITVMELLFTVALIVTLVAIGLPLMLSGLDELRTAGAARYLASRLQLARMEAVKRTARVAIRFELDGNDYRYGAYVDGNANGIRSDDIARGIDRPLGGQEHIGHLFSGVRFGLHDDVPAIGATSTGGDPIRLGRTTILTFTPIGTATSGTVYLRGRRGPQYAVRVLGVTGRTRVMKFDRGAKRWVSL